MVYGCAVHRSRTHGSRKASHLIDVNERHEAVLVAMPPQAGVVHVHLGIVLRHLTASRSDKWHSKMCAEAVATEKCMLLLRSQQVRHMSCTIDRETTGFGST